MNKISFWILTITIFLTPIFFLPFTQEIYDFNKQTLLMISAVILLVSWSISTVLSKQVKLVRSPFGLPLAIFLASWIASTIMSSPNRVDALFDPGQTGAVISLVVIFFVATNIIKTRRQLEILFYSLLASISLLAILTLIWGSGLITSLLPAGFLRSNLWTPTGGSLTTLIALASCVPALLTLLVKEKLGSPRSLFLGAVLLLTVGGSSLLGYRLFGASSTNKPIFLPISTSWAIALETLKVSPLFGTGPSTYISSFTQYKPLAYNLTPYWSVRFANASNYYLEILATIGIMGLFAYLFLVSRVITTLTKVSRTSSESPLRILFLGLGTSSVLLFVSQIFLPTSLLVLYLIMILLTLATLALKLMGSSLVHEASIDLVASVETGHKSAILPWIVLVISLGVAIPSTVGIYRVYLADVYFQRSILAAAKNDGKVIYDNLERAYKTNPYQDTYRVAYSQTNLLLANSVASKTDLTDTDRTTISQLAQLAIREAKNAVSLNPKKVANVENLATVYKSLIGSAQGAEDWTLTTYAQAIRLDPTNPNLRIATGGIFFSLKNYDDAIKLFGQAIELKPDLANAYYNLSAAYREKKDYPKAVESMTQVVKLVDNTSADYAKASSELENLKKLAGLPQEPSNIPAIPAPTELETPELLPSPKITPIQLPSELGPEPTPTPISGPIQ